MLEELTRWLRAGEGPWVYLVLGLSAAVEYIVPPMPGDSVTLLGIFLAATAGYSAWLVLGSLVAGSVVGCLAAWAFGRWLGRRRGGWPAFMQRPSVTAGVERVIAAFERQGPAYLVVNRFLPGLRAFFFVGAGLAGMGPGSVALWGGLSALLYNALLLLLGYLVGRNYDRLERIVRGYGWAALAVVVLAGGAYLALRRRRSSTNEDAPGP